MRQCAELYRRAVMTKQKNELLANGGIESVWVGQKRITMTDGSLWQQVAGNTYQKVD